MLSLWWCSLGQKHKHKHGTQRTCTWKVLASHFATVFLASFHLISQNSINYISDVHTFVGWNFHLCCRWCSIAFDIAFNFDFPFGGLWSPRYIARVPLRPPPLPHRTLYTKFTYWISNIASGWYQDKWEFRCQFAFVQFSSKWHFSARIKFILRAITVSYYLSTCDLPVCVCMSVFAFLTTPLLVLRFSRCEFLSLLYANDMRTFFSSLVLSSLYFFGSILVVSFGIRWELLLRNAISSMLSIFEMSLVISIVKLLTIEFVPENV